MQNIGVAFVKIGQFSDAVTSFEHIMGEKASFQTGKTLIMNQLLKSLHSTHHHDKLTRSLHSKPSAILS